MEACAVISSLRVILGLVCNQHSHVSRLCFFKRIQRHICKSHSHSIQTRSLTLILINRTSHGVPMIGREIARHQWLQQGLVEGRERQMLFGLLMDNRRWRDKGKLCTAGIIGRGLQHFCFCAAGRSFCSLRTRKWLQNLGFEFGQVPAFQQSLNKHHLLISQTLISNTSMRGIMDGQSFKNVWPSSTFYLEKMSSPEYCCLLIAVAPYLSES